MPYTVRILDVNKVLVSTTSYPSRAVVRGYPRNYICRDGAGRTYVVHLTSK